MNRKFILLNTMIVLFGFISSLLLYSSLPDIMAIHWNIEGNIDRYAAKYFTLFLIPLLMAALFLLLFIITKVKKTHSNIARFSEAYGYISCAILIFMAYVHVVLITANLENDFNSFKYMISGMALLFVFIGNLLPKIKTNMAMGIRTPWTLNNENVWFHTHRFAGKLVVGVSLFVFVANFVGLMPVISIGLIVSSLLIPAVYSYIISKRHLI